LIVNYYFKHKTIDKHDDDDDDDDQVKWKTKEECAYDGEEMIERLKSTFRNEVDHHDL
jgi:hypothetical protein